MSYPGTPQTAPTCYRHPDRATYIRCTRCHRPICPECMHDAAVGHQCDDCVRKGAKTVRQPKTTFGGREYGAKPVITYALIAINVVMFLLESVSPGLKSELVLFAPAVADGDLYRLVTSAFMHYGVAHLLFNMYALWVIGPPLEKWLGGLRFTALYALSALGGSVLVYLLSSLGAATAGASGAVFGLFGASFVVGKRLNLDTRWVIGLIAINLAFTFVIPLLGGQQISWQGHIGGLVTGAAITVAYAYAPRERRTLIQVSATVGLIVLFAALIWWRTTDVLAQFGIT
ncbi:MAG TPA: rhomboid family intramembrane serine protease [Mycobacterium sp.]|nr:rhomboid family intramembrane serine protease [Mycobacterium sp.]